MTHIGSLGTVYEPVTLTFDYFGETLTVADTLTDLDYIDFIEDAAGVDTNSAAGRGWMKKLAALCLGDDEAVRFWRLAKRNRQNQADVFDVLMKVVEAATERPTGQPSDSSDGQQRTAPRSAAVSSSVQARLAGRPDLQLVVAQAAEARRAG